VSRSPQPSSSDDEDDAIPHDVDPFHGLVAIDVIDGELVPRAARR
jgi:hypothetical protein